MSAKRFIRNIVGDIYDSEKDKWFEEDWKGKPLDYEDDLIVFKPLDYEDDLIVFLNEQQATINQLKEENMDLRAKQTQMIIIMKDVVRDLKRIDTYRYAEHLEKIANLHFLSEKELEDD